MADPTALVNRSVENEISANRLQGLIKTSEDLKLGALAGMLYGAGTVEFGDDVADVIPVGLVHGQPLGDNSKLLGDGTNEVVTKAGDVLKEVSVVGVTAITDTFKPVWATDGDTLTSTAPANGTPLGFIKKWHTGTSCDVQLFSNEVSVLLYWITAGVIAIP